MIDPLAAGVTVASLLGAVVAVVLTVTGRYRWRAAVRALAAAEIVLVLQGILGVVGLLRGHHPREFTTFVAYLAVSVLVLPVAAVQVRGVDDRWSAVLVAAALVVVAVVVVRAETTWRPV